MGSPSNIKSLLVIYTTVSDTHDYLCFVLENMPQNII